MTRYVLGALAVVTALAYTHDTAGNIAIAGTPTPLSIESMRALADDGCQRPPGFRPHTLQRLENSVVEVGVTDSELVMCTVDPGLHALATFKIGPPGDEYFAGRSGLIGDDWTVELGRVGPEVAVLEFVLPGGQVAKAELYGEIYLCRIPPGLHFRIVRVRAYGADGRLLREAEM